MLPAIKDTVDEMFGEKSSKEVFPLSNDTVVRGINELSQWIKDRLIQRVGKSRFFSLQPKESTDVLGLCQPLVCIRHIWNNEPHEDMLFCEPIIRSTSEEISKTLDTYIKRKGVCGKNSNIVTGMFDVGPNASRTLVHREVLVLKNMPDILKNVLNAFVKIVNKRGNRDYLKSCAKRWKVLINHFICTPKNVCYRDE